MEQVTTDKLLQDLNTVVQDAEALLRATAGQTGEHIESVRKKAAESLSAARARLGEAGAEVGATVRAAAKSTDAYVHENPWAAIGIAAGVGFLVGLLARRG